MKQIYIYKTCYYWPSTSISPVVFVDSSLEDAIERFESEGGVGYRVDGEWLTGTHDASGKNYQIEVTTQILEVKE